MICIKYQVSAILVKSIHEFPGRRILHPLQIGKKSVLRIPNDVHDGSDAFVWEITTARWFTNVCGVQTRSVESSMWMVGHPSSSASPHSSVPRSDRSIDTISIHHRDLSLIRSTFIFVMISLQKVVPSMDGKSDNRKGTPLRGISSPQRHPSGNPTQSGGLEPISTWSNRR